MREDMTEEALMARGHERGFAEAYSRALADAERTYDDVLTALRQSEIPAEVTTTGGMCLAITFPYRDGYFLLTDEFDTLSWERSEDQGWCLGYYVDEYDPLFQLTSSHKNPTTAVALAVQGLKGAR